MATDSQIAANRDNAQHSTGPRTETGKSISARNALTLGLFTKSDYVRPDEEAEYDALCKRFVLELNPEGILEDTWVTALVSANWRLRRCTLVEHQLSFALDIDPMGDENGMKIQNSVDRARSLAFNMLRRAITELRHLQTDRAITAQLAALEAEQTPLVSPKHVVVCIDQYRRTAARKGQDLSPRNGGANDNHRLSASNCENKERSSKWRTPVAINAHTKPENPGEEPGKVA